MKKLRSLTGKPHQQNITNRRQVSGIENTKEKGIPQLN